MKSSLPEIVRTRIYIDGEFVDAIDGDTFETFEPATGEVLATVAAGGPADIEVAVAAARRSFEGGSWSRIAPAERKATLLRFAGLIEQNASDLALFDAVEAGKPIADTEDGDLPDVIATLRWYAEAVDKVFGKVSPTGRAISGLLSLNRSASSASWCRGISRSPFSCSNSRQHWLRATRWSSSRRNWRR